MNKEQSKNYFLRCIPLPPLLFVISSLFNLILIPILLIIVLLIIAFLIKKKVKKAKVFDSDFKKHLLWILPLIFYLISFFVLSYSSYGYYLYVISFLILSVSILGVIFIGEKYKIFKTKTIIKFLFIILFIGASIISVIKISQAYEIWREQTETKNQFEKIINELPQPLEAERTSFHGISTANYAIYLNENEAIDFYKSNISSEEWEFLEEKTGEKSHYLRYKKTGEDLWLRLNFTRSSGKDKEYKTTSLNIGVYKFEPTLHPGTIIIINPLRVHDFCGGEQSLF